MKKPQLNHSHVSLWNDEDFARLLIEYYKVYQASYSEWERDDHFNHHKSRYDRVWFRKIKHYGGHRVHWGNLYKLYFEGHYILKKLRCSFCEFCDFMIYGVPSKYYSYVRELDGYAWRSYYWGYGWSRRNDFRDNNYRKKQKFQIKDSILKKVKSEKIVLKEEWREKSGITKDNSKPNYRRRNSCPTDYKRLGNKKHRAWVRENISKDNWDKLSNQRKWKEIIDPWDWS